MVFSHKAGTCNATQEQVAIKIEKLNTKHPQLTYESKILTIVAGIGFPKYYASGIEGDNNILVMEKLDKNIEELFNNCKRKFTLKTILQIAD